MKTSFFTLLFGVSFISATAVAASNEAEMASLLQEKKKIEAYLAEGQSPELFDSSLKQIESRLAELRKTKAAPAKRKVASTPAKEVKEPKESKEAKEPEVAPVAVTASPKAVEPAKALSAPIPAFIPAQATSPTVEKVVEAPLIKFGVMMDMYYTFISTRPAPGTPIDFRYYDNNQGDITLNLLELNFSGSRKNWSYRVDLDFGDFADQNSTDEISKHIGQANVTYDFGIAKRFALTAGKMYTHIGYEGAKAMDNFNYSRAFNFSHGGPFWHEGLALNAETESGLVAGAYLYDRWDGRSDTNRAKTVGFRLGYRRGTLALNYNYIVGPEGNEPDASSKRVHEANLQWGISDTVTFAGAFLAGSEDNRISAGVASQWYSGVLYLSWAACAGFKLNPRFEVFKDGRGGIFGQATDVVAGTLDGVFTLTDGVELRLEGRVDTASKNVFADASGNNTRTRFSGTAALLVGF
jgi:hypothetical protein